MNDEELERAMRAGLERHAHDVDTAITVPSKPRRSPWLVPLAAAAAVGVVAAGFGLLRDDDPTADPTAEAPPITFEPPPRGWRVEAWHGVQVSVPPDWAWGGAPVADSFGGRTSSELLDCGAAAFVTSAGEKILNGDRDLPYVGRPVYMTDVCQPHSDHPPAAPYVWLGADIEPGTVDLGGGWTQETVEVAGETVTAATKEASLRSQILSSARAAVARDDRCAPELAGPPQVVTTHEGVSDVESLTVCAYAREVDAIRLQYSTEVGQPAVVEFMGPPYGKEPVSCTQDVEDEWVELLAVGRDPFGGNDRFVAHYVVHLGQCPSLELQPGSSGPLLESKVAPWAVDGIPAYVTGPVLYVPELAPYFRGVLG